MLKISIVTVCFNSEKTIESTIDSVLKQDYDNIEYIIIDGKSSDKTLDIISKFEMGISVMISEKDSGIYSAMNKGISYSTGDYLLFLNSDDILESEHVISQLVDFINNTKHDVVYSRISFFKDNPNRISRVWNPGTFSYSKLKRGWHPPHPGFTVARKLIKDIGFDDKLKIAGDYDFFMRLFLVPGITIGFFDRNIVKMRIGGASTNIKGVIIGMKELYYILRKNGNSVTRSSYIIILRYLEKILQFIS